MKKKHYTIRFRKANPVNLSNVIESVVRELHCETDMYFEQLKKQWEHVVGTAGAKNTRPLSLDRGILTIAVSSPVWLTQSRFYTSSFLQKVNSFKTVVNVTVNDVVFVLDKSR